MTRKMRTVDIGGYAASTKIAKSKANYFVDNEKN